MLTIKGNKKLEVNKSEFEQLINNFQSIVIDLGTGDGRFVYKSAVENPNNLYIGIDPSAKQLEIHSKKAQKNKLNNVLFVVGSVEQLPKELLNQADTLYINLPWGSLLASIATPTNESIKNVTSLLKPTKSEIILLFGYSQRLEPSEAQRLNLPEINMEYIQNMILPYFAEENYKPRELRELTNIELKNFESTWSKKLHLTKDRPLYYIHLWNPPQK